MKFCSDCGGTLQFRTPQEDTRPRYVCKLCGKIHYENPKIIVGTLSHWNGQVLLCKRAIEPCRGRWTLPAGFMENGETSADAARRETFEEALATVHLEQLFSLINIPHINQVHLFYLAHLTTPTFSTGAESLDVQLFSEENIPWSQIAFRGVSLTLAHYFKDRRHGRFLLHEENLSPE